MEHFEIQPILSTSIPETAEFLHRWSSKREENSPSRNDVASIEKRLRWLLIENPLAKDASQHGFCVRNGSGIIVGIILSFSNAFLAGDRRIVGLCSGSFFVDPAARMQGFYLFKRYLSDSSPAFFFGTTCNANSGALWRKLGGMSVPNTEMEYIFPLNLEVMLPAVLAGRITSGIAEGLARILGRIANPIARIRRGGQQGFDVAPCRDWEKLSQLFHRHRPQGSITTDRSPEFLEWRYGLTSPNHPADVCTFRDKNGNEGWFALAEVMRGRNSRIRGVLLLDAVWPHKKVHFKQLLSAILGRPIVSKADAVFFQPRYGIDYSQGSRWMIPRKLEGPQSFALGRKGAAPLTVASLDLVAADGDSAF